MKKVLVTVFLLASFLFPSALAAQHTGHSGGTSSPAPGTRPPGDNVDLTDFKHLLQVQADQYQTAQFQTMSKDTNEALKQTQALAQLGSTASANELSNHAMAASNAVDEACKSNKQLVKMLTDVQIAGLKKLLKDLNKSESSVTRQQKTLAQAAEHTSAGDSHLTAEAANLEKALADFRTNQLNLAQEMGVQAPKPAEPAPASSSAPAFPEPPH